MTTAVVFNLVRVSENIWTICRENFHTEYGKCVATVPLFAETFNKEVSNVLCEKPVILVELLFELRIVVIQDSKDGKRTACKKCARKIVNCYRMFAELREALAGGRALDKGETYSFKRSRPQTPSTASPSNSIPVRELGISQLKWLQRQAALVKMKPKEFNEDPQQRELCFLTNTGSWK